MLALKFIVYFVVFSFIATFVVGFLSNDTARNPKGKDLS